VRVKAVESGVEFFGNVLGCKERIAHRIVAWIDDGFNVRWLDVSQKMSKVEVARAQSRNHVDPTTITIRIILNRGVTS
jgi:hypothetical protein